MWIYEFMKITNFGIFVLWALNLIKLSYEHPLHTVVSETSCWVLPSAIRSSSIYSFYVSLTKLSTPSGDSINFIYCEI